MRSLHAITGRLALVAALGAALMLAGCAGSGVELNGPGFEALGLSGNKPKEDPDVPDRAPLLVPPDKDRLPPPQQQTAGTPPENWPTDPDVRRRAEAKEAEREEKEYKEHGKTGGDIDEFEKLVKPEERASGGLLDQIFKKMN